MLPNSFFRNYEGLVVVDLWQIFRRCKDKPPRPRPTPHRNRGKQIDSNELQGDVAHVGSLEKVILRPGNFTMNRYWDEAFGHACPTSYETLSKEWEFRFGNQYLFYHHA